MSTFVFSKLPQEQCKVVAQFDKTIISADLLDINPEGLQASLSAESDKVYITLSGGQLGITYGILFAVEDEQGNVESSTAAVIVSEQNVIPYTTQTPDAFQDLIGTIQAGQSAVASIAFTLPGKDLKNAYCTWEMISSDNEVLASGNAFECRIRNDGLSSTIICLSIITCPSQIDTTLINTAYQLRYCLHVEDEVFYQFETLRVESEATVPLGTQDLVELQGSIAQLSLITPQVFEHVKVEIYKDNDKITEHEVKKAKPVGSGWLYEARLDTKGLPVTLENYTVIWRYSNKSGGSEYQESSKLWVINASIQSACGDVLARVAKARTTLYGSPDMLYPIPTILLWMRRGMDRFNGAYGIFTNFTMTNAKGAIREFWLMFTEYMAIQAQYLAEGEKAFDYTGAAISLNVDRTQYLDSMANAIKQELDNELKPLKENLNRKGNTSGDGSGDLSALSAGSYGAVGISFTPTNMGYGYYAYPFWRFS